MRITTQRWQDIAMDELSKVVIIHRLASIAVCLSGIERMALENAPGIDLIRQIQAVQMDLSRVMFIMLKSYLDTCVFAAVWSNDIAEREHMLNEVASVFKASEKYCYLIEGEFKTMQTKTFTVPNISCGGCAHTIEMKVGNIAGVTSVEADQRSQQVTVAWEEPATWAKILSLLQAINYPPGELIQLN